MFGAAQMTMRPERPVEPRCARGCRGVTPVSGLPGSPASRCPARDRASRRGSNQLPGSDRRRCHRRIEQHLPTGAIAQEAYRKYTLASITCIRDPRVKSRLWTFSDNRPVKSIQSKPRGRVVGKPEIEPLSRDSRYIAISLTDGVMGVNTC